MSRPRIWHCWLCACAAAGAAWAASEPATGSFLSQIPAPPQNVILARPAADAMALSVLSQTDASARVFYAADGQLERATADFSLKAGTPLVLTLTGLSPDTAYRYRVVKARTNEPLFPGASGAFHTARAPGDSFVFTVTADSHLDEASSLDIYARTLKNLAAQTPDFNVDLGDTFMAGKIPDRAEALKQYIAQRYWWGTVANSVPLLLVLGNHDGEEMKKRGAGAQDGSAVWACQTRKTYFSNPQPDGFYTGNAAAQAFAGPLEDYYAWTWGDALFVVLDPYWFSSSPKGPDGLWNSSLGKAQYDWLARTLRASKAKWKFVFIHQLIGGKDASGRGGVEIAPFFEWGGHELNGENTFAQHRSGWEKPVHDLLVENKVDIVFHGHDHFYAAQKKDGIVYQLVPQAALANLRRHQADEYGYKEGDFYPNAGCLRVDVSPAVVRVAYLQTGQGTPRVYALKK